MKCIRYFAGISVLIGLFFNLAFSAVDGTTGAPLGGVGTGCIKYAAHKGLFYVAETTPPAMSDFQPLSSAKLMLYTNRTGVGVQIKDQLSAVIQGGRADDDAVFPIHTANFGVTNGVSATLLAFSPMCLDSVELMLYPYAFFEVKLTNTGTTAAEAAVAFQVPTTSQPVLVAGKGIQSTQAGAMNRAVYAASGVAGAVVSAGSDNGFLTTGQCSNSPSGNLNKVAVKVSLAAGASGSVKFVYAWYNGTTTNKDGFSIGPDRLYYTNFFNNAGSVADAGLVHFDRLRSNAMQIVTRMRASNFPDWLKDQALNSLCNITANSIYAKDGRFCHTEGEWSTNGTMDQMWHARQIYTMVTPRLAWQELDYWARTQKTAASRGAQLGQIHHDMGAPAAELRTYAQADAPDYGYQPDCGAWVDLNGGFIISIYEAYIATGDKAKLDYFWPFAKKAGQRIFDQLAKWGDKSYSYTFAPMPSSGAFLNGDKWAAQNSLNTYDQPNNDLTPFNSGLSSVIYRVMMDLAQIQNDNTLKSVYQKAYDSSKANFEKKHLTNNWPTEQRFVESILAGQWISFYLKYGQLYSQTGLDFGLGKLNSKYQAATKGIGFNSNTQRTYQEWAPYLVSHYGGLCIQTGNLNLWKSMQNDWYNRNFLNRNLVFNQPLDIPAPVSSPTYLANNTSVYDQYMSLPVVWRNYYSLMGFYRNKPTGELWLEPIVMPDMNHKMQNAFYFSPEGSGTISVNESGMNFRSSHIEFKPDNAISVSTLYLIDKSTEAVSVYVNNVEQQVTRIGSGYSKELKVAYSGTVAPGTGLTIRVVYGTDIVSSKRIQHSPVNQHSNTRTIKSSGELIVFPKEFSGKPKIVSVYTLSGASVGSATVTQNVVNLRKDLKIAEGSYIVRVKAR